MNILQSLAQGLRGAAGVLSPAVQKQTFAQDEREAALKQQMALQMAVKEAEQKRLDAREQALAQAVRGPLEAGDYEGAARAAAVTPGGLQTGLGLLDKADARRQKLLEVQTAIEARNAEARQRHLDRMTEIQQRSQDQLARDREMLAERQRFQAEEAQRNRDNQRFLASFAASLRQQPAPTPVEIADPNDPTKAIKIDARTGRKIGDSAPKKPSAAVEKELLSIDQQERVIDGGLKAVQDVPTAFTFTRGAATMTGPLTESIAGRFDNPKEQEARSYVFNIVSKVINERAGAAQSAQELARLRSFLPAETDSPTQIKSKLTAFKNYLSDQRSAVTKISGQSSSQSVLDQADAIIGGSR